jgi:hypothetical protein
MTYYELPNRAKVFAAGAFTLAELVCSPQVARIISNLWSRLGASDASPQPDPPAVGCRG